MTEVLEGIAFLLQQMEQPQKCDHQKPNEEWRCKLDGNSDSLAKNLYDHCGVIKPDVPKTIDKVSYTCWPSQAHHLIPWQQLLKHDVIQWLKKTPPRKPKKLLGDANYSVDHGKNGKFMPYVSKLKGWRRASKIRKQKIAETVMGAAGMQLHQGPHSTKNYGIGVEGYNTRVREYLDRIHFNERHHLQKCEDCQSKSEGGKVPPRRNVVGYMDTVSTRLEVDINIGRIYVSRRAAAFALRNGVMG